MRQGGVLEWRIVGHKKKANGKNRGSNWERGGKVTQREGRKVINYQQCLKYEYIC